LATSEDLFFEIDRKSIIAAASRARPTAIDAASQLDAAPCKLVLDAHGTGHVEHIGGNHDSHPSMVPWHF
jgi:hypothetical protein